MIRALLFDFDGVLAETFSLHFAAWKAVLPADLLLQEMMVRRQEGAPAYRIAQAIFAANNRSIDEAQARTLAEDKNRCFRRSQGAQMYAQVPALLELAESVRVKIGLVTGTSWKNLERVLPAELFPRFHCMVKEGDAQRGKPYPDPYQTAARLLQVRAADCLAIENAPLGIESARAAGMHCVALMTTLPVEDLRKANWIFRDHQELLDNLPILLAGDWAATKGL